MSPAEPRGSVKFKPTNVPTIANSIAPKAKGHERGHQKTAPSAPARSTAPMIASGSAAPSKGSTATRRLEWTPDAVKSVRAANTIRIRMDVIIRPRIDVECESLVKTRWRHVVPGRDRRQHLDRRRVP